MSLASSDIRILLLDYEHQSLEPAECQAERSIVLRPTVLLPECQAEQTANLIVQTNDNFLAK